MNQVQLIGNLTKDVETYTTQGGVKRANFTLAVNRAFKNQRGEREADFVPCVVWKEKAELCEKYLSKGKKVYVVGNIQTRSYDTQDGSKRFVFEVVVQEIGFLPSGEKQPQKAAEKPQEMTLSDEPDLPF